MCRFVNSNKNNKNWVFVQVLLPASSILQIVSVREACWKFLMRQLHPTNCLGIRNFADTHACKELHKRSHKFALQNFQEVMSTEEFLLLPFQEVVRDLGFLVVFFFIYFNVSHSNIDQLTSNIDQNIVSIPLIYFHWCSWQKVPLYYTDCQWNHLILAWIIYCISIHYI